MNAIGFIIGLSGLALICIVVWMVLKQKNAEIQKAARETARRNRIRAVEEERKERLKLAEEGHIPTMLYLAKEAERVDLSEALRWYEAAADLENVTGMYGVARVTQKARHDAIMDSKHRFWQRYIRGMEGDLNALCETAQCYLKGSTVPVDVEKAVRLLEKTVKSRYQPGMIQLADWYMSHDNPSRNLKEGFRLYEEVTKLGNDIGMMKLGQCYLQGMGVTKDHLQGCYWLECAAEQGNAQAMYYAGEAWVDMNKYGNSIAYIWLYLSAHCNYAPAVAFRDIIGNQIGVDVVVPLQKFAKPLVKKLQEKTLGRHIMIRALNRLYDRHVPILSSAVVKDETNAVEDIPEAIISEVEQVLPLVDELQPQTSDSADDEAASAPQVKPDFTDKRI